MPHFLVIFVSYIFDFYCSAYLELSVLSTVFLRQDSDNSLGKLACEKAQGVPSIPLPIKCFLQARREVDSQKRCLDRFLGRFLGRYCDQERLFPTSYPLLFPTSIPQIRRCLTVCLPRQAPHNIPFASTELTPLSAARKIVPSIYPTKDYATYVPNDRCHQQKDG